MFFIIIIIIMGMVTHLFKKKLLCIEPLTFTGSALKWVGLQSA